MGGLFGGGGGQTSTSTTTQNVPKFVTKGGTAAVNAGIGELDTPFPPFTAPRFAQFNPDELAAFQGTRESFGGFDPFSQAAQSQIPFAAQRFTDPGVLEQYTNPFQRGVTDVAIGELERRDLFQKQQRDSSAVSAGAFGGSRQAIVEGEAQRNLSRNIADTSMAGGLAGFQEARSQFGLDRNNAMNVINSILGIGGQDVAQRRTDIGGLGMIGGDQRGLQQQQLDFAYNQFIQERDFEMMRAQQLGSIVGGVPIGQTATTTQTQPGPSAFSQIAGLGLAGLGAASGLGWTPFASATGGVSGFGNSSKVFKNELMDAPDVLDGIEELPIKVWEYKPELEALADEKAHIGPYAEDMKEIFKVGDGVTINYLDAIGILFKANQELIARVKELEEKVGEG